MSTLISGDSFTGDITLTKQSGTTLTLETEKTYVDRDIEFTLSAQSGATTYDVASADVNVKSDSSGRNISGVIGTKASSAPSTGYYIKMDASGSGNSKVTTAGWLNTGSLASASTTVTKYFPVTSSTVTLGTPSVNASGLVTSSSTVTAGYASATTYSKTLQLTTVSATTYTPTVSNQTISSGKYTTGTQTILGDSNLIAENIKKDVVLFGVTGTHTGGQGVNVVETLDTHGGTIVTITSDAEVYGTAEEVAF